MLLVYIVTFAWSQTLQFQANDKVNDEKKEFRQDDLAFQKEMQLKSKKAIGTIQEVASIKSVKSTIFSENFEGGVVPPAGWSVVNTNALENWKILSTGPIAGSHSAQVLYDEALGQQDEWLVSPSFSLAGKENAFLSFSIKTSYNWMVSPNNNGDLFVKISTNGGTDWTTLWKEDDYGVFADWATLNLDLNISSYVGQADVKIAFQYYALDAAQVILDNILVYDIAANDAGITAIVAPTGTKAPGNYDVVVTLKNFGGSDLTAVDIDYQIGATTGTYNWTGTLAPNAQSNVTIVTGHDFTTLGTYAIVAATDLAGDANAANDQASGSVNIANIVFFESFDVEIPADWTVTTSNVTYPWTRVTTGTYPTTAPHSGAGMLKYASYSVTSGNWSVLYSPMVSLIKNATVKFWMNRDNGYLTTADRVEIYANTAANETGAVLIGTVNRSINLAPVVATGGWYEYAFDVPSAFNGQDYYLLFKGISAYGNNIYVDDISLAGETFIPSASDAGITAIVSPTGTFYAGAKDIVVTLKNFGSDPITDLNIDWDINGTTGSYNWTGTLAGAASTNVTVTNFNFATTGAYTITVTSDLGGDADNTNDQATATVNVFEPFTTPYVQNFDGVTAPALPALWTVLNENADSYAWTTYATGANSAPNAMSIRYNSALAMDDWFFSPKISLQSGSTYKVSFMYRGSAYNESLKLMWGTDNTPVGMTEGVIFDNPSFNFSTYVLVEETITPTTTGLYNFGFHGYSAANMNRIYVDNFSIVEVLANDIEAKGIVAPAFAGVNVPLVLSGKVKNVGTSDNTFDVTVSVTDEALTEVFSNTKNVSLTAGQELTVAFDEWIPATDGTYLITLETELAGDQNAANNTITKTISIVDGLLWGWNIDATGSTSGIVATKLGALANGLIETADDFILPAGEWKIDSIATNGFKSAGVPDPTNFLVIVYANNAGAPGEVVYEAIVPITNPTHQQLVFEEPLILEGGHYWLVVAGNYPEASALAAGRWNWKTMVPLFEGQAMLRDNPNVFGAGATNWTPLTTLGVNVGSTDFSVWGKPYVAYNVTVNVNPTGAGLVEGEESWNLQIEQGTEIELTAAANEGFLFVNWTDGEANVMGIDATLTHTVVADIDIIANFREIVSATIDPIAGSIELANPSNLSTVITWNDATMVSSIVMHDPTGDWELEEGFDYEIVDIDGTTAELTFNFSDMFNKKGIKAIYDIDFEIFFDLGESATYTLSLDLGDFVVVEFKVTDATTGNPISDATLTIEGDEYGAGEYVDVFEPGTYSYSVARFGYNTFEGTFVVVDQNLVINVALEPITFNVTFSVMGENGALMAEVDGIEIMSGDEVALGKDVMFTATPDNGYQVKNWYLNDEPMGFTTTTFNVNDLAADVDVMVEFEMIPVMTYTVTFMVTDQLSNPITDAVITFDGVAAAVGEYVFTNVEAGTYEYSVSREGFVIITGSVEVIDEDVVEHVALIGDNVTTGTFANFSAYPNPFSSQISISNAAVVSRVTIANIIGQNVLDIRTNGAESVVTSTLPAGVYLVTFEAANGDRLVRKMVKK